MLALPLAALLPACEPPPPVGQEGAATGFLGVIAGEEPRAVLTARDVLSAGGSAADAVVAGYFTMAATYPVAVGLGGGGACVVYDRAADRAEALSFPLTAPKGGGEVALPGALRAMAVLHARYGRLNWGQLVAPAESLSRFGHPASRALVRRHAAAAVGRPAVAALFADGAEGALREGGGIRQVELSGTLGLIRSRGVGVMYGGPLGRAFVDAAGAVGGRLTLEDLRGYRVGWQPVVQQQFGNHQVMVPPGWPAGEALLAGLRAQADGNAAASGTRGDLRKSRDGAGFAVMVADGSGVACSFTMGRAFGNARMAPGLGFLVAPAAPGGASPSVPVVLANEFTDQSFFAAAGAGPSAAAMLATVLQGAGRERLPLDQALERAIALDPGGETLLQVASCPGGVRDAADLCEVRTDSRGAGYAIGGDL